MSLVDNRKQIFLVIIKPLYIHTIKMQCFFFRNSFIVGTHPVYQISHFLCTINGKSYFCNDFFSSSITAIDILVYFERSAKISLYDESVATIILYQSFEYI